MDGFKYKIENKNYHTWNYHLRNRFNSKVFKVSLNGGFTCPNLDGTISRGGCTFCSNKGSGDFAGQAKDSISKQFDEIKNIMSKKWPEAKYIAYFQAYTNTYASVDYLKEKYEEALDQDGVVGIAISTRPDCINDSILDYLTEINERTNLWVELGLQTIHDTTSKRINRGHGYDVFLECLNKLRDRDIDVVVHIINGLPGEDYNMMMETAKRMAQLDIQGIKIHLLHVLKGTIMEKQLKRGEFSLLDKDFYIKLICDQLEVLPQDLVIHRLTGDGKKEDLIGPLWSLKKWEVLNAIDNELKTRNSWQGKYFEG